MFDVTRVRWMSTTKFHYKLSAALYNNQGEQSKSKHCQPVTREFWCR